MKVATWNVNSIRMRQEQVKNWLLEHSIDVLCLQETKVVDQSFPQDPFEEIGYHLYIFGQKAYNGVAMFSKQPLKDVIMGFSPIVGDELGQTFDQQKRVISGVIDNVRIVNLYVPNGASLDSDKYQYKLSWFEILETYLKTLLDKESHELCICGDFNIALEDRDIYNPKNKVKHIMSSPPERAALQKILDLGLQDCFRKFTEETGNFSWWDYRSGGFKNNRGWRIDHHYLSRNLYQKAISCTIDTEPRKLEKPSDHAPVIVEF
ncbi:MAG: exodeoxyribonuclease III [Microcystaceae cyanobacterium]